MQALNAPTLPNPTTGSARQLPPTSRRSFTLRPFLHFPVMSPFWLLAWAVFVSLCWLLPVTSPPWSTFPSETWMAMVSLLALFAVLLRVRTPITWHGITCLVAALTLLPWLQLWLGLLPYGGQAWMSSLYLLGLLLAMLTGALWEPAAPLQLAHALFLAILIASIGSVAIQLYAWLGLSVNGNWGVFFTGLDSVRPAGNLGQPNQLATLLLWGLIACIWGTLHGAIRGRTSLLVAAFLLVGLALTQSRTGLLVATLMLIALWSWRRLWPDEKLHLAATALYLYYLSLPPLLKALNIALLLGQDSDYFRLQEQSAHRLHAWRMFLQAALERPWFGYGWTETNSAQMAVADRFPGLESIFSHSHNLVVDLILWTGLPLGLFIAAVLVRWFWLKVFAVNRAEEALLLMLVGVVATHAMLEFPLQYAYFLLPTGLVIGILNARLADRVLCVTSRWVFLCLGLMGAAATAVTVRDYVQVEASYSLLRIEQGPIGEGRRPMGGPPDVWVLSQMREWIKQSRAKARAQMSPHEMEEFETITRHFPSLSFAYRQAVALALNGQPEEARAWLGKICKFTDERECQLARLTWERESPADARTASIKWPQ